MILMDNFSYYINTFFFDRIRNENIKYNFSILTKLCNLNKEDKLLNKPIIILLVSIVECILYELLKRIMSYDYPQGIIPGIDNFTSSETQINTAKETDFSRFFAIISYFEKDRTLLEMDADYYKKLDELRNNVHIQINKEKEETTWTREDINSIGEILIKTCEAGQKFNRGDQSSPIYDFSDFPKPWSSENK